MKGKEAFPLQRSQGWCHGIISSSFPLQPCYKQQKHRKEKNSSRVYYRNVLSLVFHTQSECERWQKLSNPAEQFIYLFVAFLSLLSPSGDGPKAAYKVKNTQDNLKHLKEILQTAKSTTIKKNPTQIAKFSWSIKMLPTMEPGGPQLEANSTGEGPRLRKPSLSTHQSSVPAWWDQ